MDRDVPDVIKKTKEHQKRLHSAQGKCCYIIYIITNFNFTINCFTATLCTVMNSYDGNFCEILQNEGIFPLFIRFSYLENSV